MSDFEWWEHQCRELDAADKAMREALETVTRHMVIGGTGTPSETELDALDLARAKRDAIDADMKAFIEKRFGKSY